MERKPCKRSGGPPPGARAAGGGAIGEDGEGGEGGSALYAGWAPQSETEITSVLASVAKLVGATRVLAGALARAGALGAAARLARRFAGAHAAAEREAHATCALRGVREVLRAAGRQLPEARARARGLSVS